ncbi:hypothetical protein GDI3582 [Gluconacetobacter diazotrophicus PA1 5]|uniref:Uncharacterized protein n=1 Tax=Gluconacetobacter diazotrophicus (strain ATCC 49037 / DSM 5601 / CCUG 37298 / CIP 103539 / LMG 7603 / PAl5) TaxID=272568 RepID=A9H6N8_GLUDA|nr:hypothetical protein GDI3582 [Gluconacetobacter diazotrophicus PA1 5]
MVPVTPIDMGGVTGVTDRLLCGPVIFSVFRVLHLAGSSRKPPAARQSESEVSSAEYRHFWGAPYLICPSSDPAGVHALARRRTRRRLPFFGCGLGYFARAQHHPYTRALDERPPQDIGPGSAERHRTKSGRTGRTEETRLSVD